MAQNALCIRQMVTGRWMRRISMPIRLICTPKNTAHSMISQSPGVNRDKEAPLSR